MKRLHQTYLLLVLLIVGITQFGKAQTAVYLEGNVDSTLLVGQQVAVKLGVIYNVSQGAVDITFPQVSDSLGDGFMIVKRSKWDTSLVDPQNDQYTFRIEQNMLVTAFREGQQTMGPYMFSSGSANFYTDSLTFEYALTEVDTTQDIRDIKEIEAVNYGVVDFLKDNWKVIVGIVVLLAILAGAAQLYLKRKREEKVEVKPVVKEIIPPHIEALQALKKIREEKLWQNPEPKEFYSQITYVVRNYIEQRFNIPAKEQTTSEILYAINTKGISEEDRSILNELLPLSDMVKFAKEKPSESISEGYIERATQFIHHTKPQEENQKSA